MKIDNIDDLETVMSQRHRQLTQLQITPLSDKTLSGSSIAIETSDSRLELTGYRGVLAFGAVSDRFATIGTVIDCEPGNTFCNVPIRKGDISWVPAKSECHAIYASSVRYCLLFMTPERLEERLDEHDLDLRSLPYRVPKLGAGNRLNLVKTIGLLEKNFGESTEDYISQDAFEEIYSEIFTEMIESLCHASDATSRVKDRNKRYLRVVTDAQYWVYRNQDCRNVSAISSALGISRRTLHRAFINIMNISPNVFLRNCRLAKARRDLRLGRWKRVSDCALFYGFLDAGRFANYYRNLFGELPSLSIRD